MSFELLHLSLEAEVSPVIGSLAGDLRRGIWELNKT